MRCLIDRLGIDRGLEVHHVGDLPARSGMGSSSSFTVGLLHAMQALQGADEFEARAHATQSIEIEQGVLQEVVGSQDQVSAAYGGFNQITFCRSGDIRVDPVILPPDRVARTTSSRT